MNVKGFTYFDYILFLAVILLTTIGISFIYSSGINSDGALVSNEFIKQILWASIGIVLMLVVAMLDYRRYADRTFLLFAVFLSILVYTRIFGRYVNGAKSWIGIGELGIQPSEFSKIIYILYLAYFLDRSSGDPAKLSRFIKSGLIMGIPMLLILSQPDLGTASVYIPIFIAMAFMAGIPLRFIGMVLIGGSLSLLFTLMPLWQDAIVQKPMPAIRILTEMRFTLIALFSLGVITVLAMMGRLIFKTRYYYWIAYFTGLVAVSLAASLGASRVLKPYQLMRLIVFLDPNVDPLGSGWNIIQSITAIGSGGPFGMGYLQGTQSHYRFLPQQSTDFIFSILSEEWGFLGGLVVFILYGTILARSLIIIKKTENNFGALVATGIAAMYFFHFMVNIGMVMGMMPITGIPLLFVSYGGSSLWTAMTASGLLMSINMRRLDH
ncbi:rod shape-determining protein RodA [Treponema zuelzerae]|uniref:Peptidoglycan glycosyltransferase RodA n=1 Tax=Teretinema zuelzerae TaxID=156 RepID=A0AAE3JIU8_9SPIR|nr:rod shape-determining protein RodA [Teretinema zuelzerae]MCD1654596.1 rod shape-determining protein RodA [Teretinema zuelzerae]